MWAPRTSSSCTNSSPTKATRIAGEDVGGTFARRVMFKPHSGRAFVKRLDSVAASNVAREELSIVVGAPWPAAAAGSDDIELF